MAKWSDRQHSEFTKSAGSACNFFLGESGNPDYLKTKKALLQSESL